jgi:hypothetical protein
MDCNHMVKLSRYLTWINNLITLLGPHFFCLLKLFVHFCFFILGVILFLWPCCSACDVVCLMLLLFI